MPMTFRFTPEAAKRIKSFLADYAGKPIYAKPGPFAEAAILREIERIEVAISVDAPLRRVRGGVGESPVDDERGPVPRRPINAH